VPGVSVGVVQDGRVVFAGGFGAREFGSTAKVDDKTLYLVGSNTKALTTLMLAKLVDEGRFTWETPVTALMPSFGRELLAFHASERALAHAEEPCRLGTPQQLGTLRSAASARNRACAPSCRTRCAQPRRA
jgi:CubicO group peptidase (beta-lactamase class C family)